MAKNKKTVQPIDEVRDLLKKFLILELFKMGTTQAEIGKKVRMDLAAVNTFLKSIKKNPK